MFDKNLGAATTASLGLDSWVIVLFVTTHHMKCACEKSSWQGQFSTIYSIFHPFSITIFIVYLSLLSVFRLSEERTEWEERYQHCTYFGWNYVLGLLAY